MSFHAGATTLLGLEPSSRIGSRLHARMRVVGVQLVVLGAVAALLLAWFSRRHPGEVRAGVAVAALIGALAAGPLAWRTAARWCVAQARQPGGGAGSWLPAVQPETVGATIVGSALSGLALGLLFGLAIERSSAFVGALPVLALGIGAAAIAATDVVAHRIPRVFVTMTGGPCFVLVVVASVVSGEPASVIGAAAGAAALAGVLLAVHVLRPAGMGLGDVRFGAVLGLVVGWEAWAPAEPLAQPAAAAVAALLLACLIAVAGHVASALSKPGLRPMAFAPPLALGSFVVILAW